MNVCASALLVLLFQSSLLSREWRAWEEVNSRQLPFSRAASSSRVFNSSPERTTTKTHGSRTGTAPLRIPTTIATTL